MRSVEIFTFRWSRAPTYIRYPSPTTTSDLELVKLQGGVVVDLLYVHRRKRWPNHIAAVRECGETRRKVAILAAVRRTRG